MRHYDFSGYATKNDIRCSDGRTIRRNAFIDNDGMTVPLVWNHDHKELGNVLGHALLENRPDGVYAYCSFNDSAEAQKAKTLVNHGDIRQMSIFANGLKQTPDGSVMHGKIREVSLVFSGANPGAFIQTLDIQHSDDPDFDEVFAAEIYTGEDFTLAHADDDGEESMADIGSSYKIPKNNGRKVRGNMTIQDVIDSLTSDQKHVFDYLIGQALQSKGGTVVQHSDDISYEDAEYISETLDTLDDTQETVLNALVGEAIMESQEIDPEYMQHSDEYDDDDYEDYENDYEEDTDMYGEKSIDEVLSELTEDQIDELSYLITDALSEEMEHSDDFYGEDTLMHTNVFDGSANDEFLMHADAFFDDSDTIFADARRMGSLKDSVLAHAAEYGIENIDYLFPDSKALSNEPDFINIHQEFVKEFMDRVHKSPFARIKSIHADITEAEARAKGYTKGNKKLDEVFKLLKRVTSPTTVYKHQKMDRNDILDITDFDVIVFLKKEMRMKLDEEIVRACLVGDGRAESAADKIDEQCIRPIWTDDDLYTIKSLTTVSSSATEQDRAKALIISAIKARKDYRGSGNPILFTTEDILTSMLLITDSTGRDIYDTQQKLETKLRVSKIVTSEVLENLTRTFTPEGGSQQTRTLAGIIVNPADYNVGTDKGGEVSMFDDFDIDYNQQKYLIETRLSGALTKPYSAIALEIMVNPQ